MVGLYRSLVFPLADTIKLNQTELEYLTDTKISSAEDAWKAMESLHGYGVEHVVVSSVGYLGDSLIGILASTKTNEGKYLRYSMQVAKKNEYYTGTGDLFSSLLLAWMDKQGNQNLGKAVQNTVSSIQHVLEHSNDAANERLKLKEIRLIKSAPSLVNPEVLIPYVDHQAP
jgi:pyridoxine kinase